ncbi:alpha/beta hydrolase [Sphingomonas sp. BAUL-RG-20F-R05-02]|uniref:alpha/beta hydrolase n=1 Tax=Sphingomonas sp. BAUL-RG-20F-R05-02 TaxID=2914830 RepID=UPI001F57D989|nr:hypothetical protein [Sphingomonas sp. BAUL-RG-20F-R05-02]
MTDPKQAPWLLHFQQSMFEAKASTALKDRFDTVLQPVINANFANSPSSIPAFLSMTGDAVSNLAFNTRHASDLRAFTPPVQLIWGTADPYLNSGVCEALAAQFPNSRIKSLPANHWPQIDLPQDVAAAMLAVVAA